MINIVTYLNCQTPVLLNSLKLSKKDSTNYNITVIGKEDLNIKKVITSLIGNDFKIHIEYSDKENLNFIDILKYFQYNNIKDNFFLLDSVIVNRDLSELTTSEFGSMLVQSSCDKSENNLKKDFIYRSNCLYFNTDRIFSENLLEDISDEFENNKDDEILNSYFIGRILPFKHYVIKYSDEDDVFFKINKLKKLSNLDEYLFMFPVEEKKYLLENTRSYNNIKQCRNINISELSLLRQTHKTVVFNFDKNNLQQFIVSCGSLLNSCKYTLQIVCLIDNSISLDDKNYIQLKLSNLFKDRFILNFINVNEHLKSVFSKKLFEVRGISSIAYARLFIPFLLENFTEVIYSDCDVIFKKDPFERLESIQNKDNFLIYGVPSIRLFGRNNSSLYLNSGFIYYNLKSQESKSESLRKLIESELETNNLFQDQDILNRVYEGKKGKLPPTFCMIPKCYVKGIYNTPTSYRLFSKTEINELSNPIIVHWAGVNKPWNSDVGKKIEWISINECILSDKKIEITEEKLYVKNNFLKSFLNNINRNSLADLIGEENMIPKIASYPIGLVNINTLPEMFVLRRMDYSDSFICDNKEEFKEKSKKFLLNKIPTFAEKFMENCVSYFVEQDKTGIFLSNKTSLIIDIQAKEKILYLAQKIYNKFKIDCRLEFIVDKKGKVYFRDIC